MAWFGYTFLYHTSNFGLESSSVCRLDLVATGLQSGVKLLKRAGYGILIAVRPQTLKGGLQPRKGISTNECWRKKLRLNIRS